MLTPLMLTCCRSSPSIKTRQTNIPKLELDVLYKTASKLTASERYQFTEKLNICYGDISGPEQYWESIPGEEVSILATDDCYKKT